MLYHFSEEPGIKRFVPRRTRIGKACLRSYGRLMRSINLLIFFRGTVPGLSSGLHRI